MTTLIVLSVGIICGLWYFHCYNEFVRARNAVDQSWSNVEVELMRRWELIENLVQTVKGYAAHEADTLIQVVEARGGCAKSAEDANGSEGAVKETVGKLIALSESYPELKADQQFLDLQGELVNTEDRIAERRHAYNQTVSMYQNLFLAFPSNIVASFQEMEARSFYDAPEGSEEAPVIGELS